MRNAMVGLSVSLCVLFTCLIFLLAYIIEDQVFINQLKAEQIEFEKVYLNENEERALKWTPNNSNIKLIRSVEKLPRNIANNVQQRIIAQAGIHEYFDGNNAFSIANIALPSADSSYFLLYDVKNLLAVRGSKLTLFALIGGLTLLITIVAIFLARRLTRSTLAPISNLSNALKSKELDHVVIELANEFSEDDVGMLAREVALSLDRVRASATREYEFNRGVSHELRSPIQVAQSAIELLQLASDDDHLKFKKPISRLHRAVTEMNEIAQAFLWLASDRQLKPNEMCSVTTLPDIVASVQSTYADSRISVNTSEFNTPFSYPMPNAVLSVVVRNLLRNAVTHGDNSTITVTLKPSFISISNSTSSNHVENGSFGVGLSIVERICERFKCALQNEQQGDGQFVASVTFLS